MRLFHISDLHFQADIPLRRFPRLGWRRLLAQTEYRILRRRDRFRGVVPTVARLLAEAEAWGADHLLVSGDLTAIALPEEFEEARLHLASWSGRMTILPGNHDRYTPAAARSRLFEQAFAKELTSDLPGVASDGVFPLVKLVGSDGAVVALTSARVPITPGFAMGWVGRRQRAALAALLERPELKRRGVLVSCHHAPFLADGRPDRPNHGLVDAGAVLAVVREGGALGLGHGHIHRRYRIDSPGRPPVFCAGSSTQAGREGGYRYTISPGHLAAEQLQLAPVLPAGPPEPYPSSPAVG